MRHLMVVAAALLLTLAGPIAPANADDGTPRGKTPIENPNIDYSQPIQQARRQVVGTATPADDP
jgi:hypothetical protein